MWKSLGGNRCCRWCVRPTTQNWFLDLVLKLNIHKFQVPKFLSYVHQALKSGEEVISQVIYLEDDAICSGRIWFYPWCCMLTILKHDVVRRT